MNIDVSELSRLARLCVGASKYKLKALPVEAPLMVDCSSFVQWLFGCCDVYMPRLAYQQFHWCDIHVPTSHAQSGDLVFRTGRHPRYEICPVLAVGHVGFVTVGMTVVHAASKGRGVIESSLMEFMDYKKSGICAGRNTSISIITQ